MFFESDWITITSPMIRIITPYPNNILLQYTAINVKNGTGVKGKILIWKSTAQSFVCCETKAAGRVIFIRSYCAGIEQREGDSGPALSCLWALCSELREGDSERERETRSTGDN